MIFFLKMELQVKEYEMYSLYLKKIFFKVEVNNKTLPKITT